MKIRVTFDVEAQDLHKEGFAFGYVVTKHENGKIEELEKGECYSIEGAKGASNWVKENIVPHLNKLKPYLGAEIVEILPKDAQEIVLTTKELRDRFFEVWMKWKKEGAELWSDVNFPVETNFLTAVVVDGKGTRDWEMPYPLHDVSAFVTVDVDREKYSGLIGLSKHNPLDDARASAYSLHLYELENEKKIQQTIEKKVTEEVEKELARRELGKEKTTTPTFFG